MKTMNLCKEDFRGELNEMLALLAKLRINSGDLHRRMGGYPSRNHRLFTCCKEMRRAMCGEDEIVEMPPKGNGASLTIEYVLPR